MSHFFLKTCDITQSFQLVQLLSSLQPFMFQLVLQSTQNRELKKYLNSGEYLSIYKFGLSVSLSVCLSVCIQ